ncbi:BrnT family toxin [Methylobacterium sp. WL69]|uniref:BrnT family toxin n=1 Tax=Methylobacterium sp. WL69 TaxID=2603893 RepID=UPI0011C9BA46|nr:BrnT family toxin [Methylobacterium sp. WL69]TXM75106.1 BrnT family toxin [Methylobacterium sp. WL69]
MGENDHPIWDDPKNNRNINERKIDFADLDAISDGRFAIVTEDTRHDYGERRFNMLVEIGELILNVTFTKRPPKYRVISARIASRIERRMYHAKSQES